jgi:hypothetical protein
MELLENGVKHKKELKEILIDPDTGKKISNKILWESLKIMQEDDTIEEVPVKGKDPAYDLTSKFRTKEFDQLVYFNMLQKEEFFSDIIRFQHSVYGLPSYDKMTEYEQRIAIGYLHQIDDALDGMKKLKERKEPEKLALQLLIDDFADALYRFLENEPDVMKSFHFITRLVGVVITLEKEMQFKIWYETRPYSMKLFRYTLFPDYRFMRRLLPIKNSPVLLKNDSKNDIALLSTPPVNQAKVVRENIELTLNALFEEGLRCPERYKKRLAFGNLNRLAEVVSAGRRCRGGRWTKEGLSQKKFLSHKQLNKYFSAEEIEFMLSVIKALSDDFKDIIMISEIEQFIVYKGFGEGGLWYGENKNYFYDIADEVVKSIDGEEFNSLHPIDRIEKIKESILKNPNTPPNLKKDVNGKYGLRELVIYIDARSYFEKVRSIIKRKLAEGFWLRD